MNDILMPPCLVQTAEPRALDAGIPRRASPRPIVIVLGMHRSGTSLCAHVLSALGVDMADEVGAEPSNPNGHWERREIVAFHDAIFQLFHRSYYGPTHDLALPPAWWADPRVARLRRRTTAFLRERMDRELFGFKDPRTARLRPVWQQVFASLNLAPKIVLCLRNPAEVARSLQVRDGLEHGLGEYRWLVYLAAAFGFIGNRDFCLVEYEHWFADPAANIAKLRRFLALDGDPEMAELDALLTDVVDAGLRHDSCPVFESRSELVRRCYRLAQGSAADPAARARLRSLLTDFAALEAVQRPLQQLLEAQQAAAAAERDAIRAAYDALLRSRSWRLTAPLRRLRAVFG